jgi:hypothetical protein
MDTIDELQAPDKVFIVPYRDREPHKLVFTRVMPHILGDSNYRILFVHQHDKRPFNRGAIKNTGFHYVKKTWPEHWKDMTLIFHDIDFMAYKIGQFSFDTKQGEVNHFYGYPHTLGGIFAIKGIDFQTTAGFPNIWTWGLEDNVLFERVKASGMKIVYPQFLHAQHNAKDIISLWHGWDRLLNPDTGLQKIHYIHDSLWTMRSIKWNDVELEDKIWMVNVTDFDVPITVKNPVVQNARVANSLINRTFKSWRHQEAMNRRTKRKSTGGLLIKWGRK